MWRVVGIMLVTWLLLQVLTFIPGLLMSFVTTMMFGDSIELFSLKQNIDTIVTYTTQILVLPFLLGVYTVLYYDLRVRKEGYDLEMAIAEPYESPVYPYETN
jgi:membrane glycosyltransferase